MYNCANFAAKSQKRFCMQTNCLRKVPWRFVFFLCLFIPFASISQENQNSVSGLVLDEKSQPMPAVTVVIESGQFKKSTQTNAEGAFRFDGLDVSLVYTISFSHVGYAQETTTNVRAGSGLPISVTMKLNVGTTADEVVVVGYGTQTRRDV